MKEPIDWQALALQLGALKENGEISGSHFARQAVEILLGEDNLQLAVDYYISAKPGSELARSVLWLLHPFSAMQHCYDVYKSEAPIQDKRIAVELLRVVADKRAVNWINEFLEDEDVEIQSWGAGVLDQLLYSGLVEPEDVEYLLKKAETHTNDSVRERVEHLRSFLHDGLGRNKEVCNETDA